MRRLLVPVLAAALGLSALTTASPAVSSAPAGDRPFPARIELPDGFQPEGIAIGPGATAWLGSLDSGDIYRVSLRTGEGEVVVTGDGTPAVGLKRDGRGRLYVAGGESGTARVIDTRSGAVSQYALEGGFVNDVVLTRQAAWFTDSQQPRLYRLARGAGGSPAVEATPVPLTGEWVQGSGFGANGIATAPGGKALLVVNSTSGLLYRVDPATGAATEVDLGGTSLTRGDGMLRHGRLLYVVRNRDNEVDVIRLDRTGLTGERVRTITSPDFDVPTTVAGFGKRLYLPNARFRDASAPLTQPADYWISQVRGGRS
ncbi:Sugar lactone lactonase YvrE [Nocardioides alpinus]|uniref:Sugar lactone lactonase YvrE n=1 Tax=Nocardioides alpinus TaxID=748909 RepID=A0A1I0ZNW2_9ACTN|nr:superoxide dismutase [Nocardioides alpinus]SFB27335.1 Sugar lactone lactonase YvrE [Nocardioides alpinus]